MSYGLDTDDVLVNAGEGFGSKGKGGVSSGGVRKKGGKKKQTAAAIDAVGSREKERSDGEKKRMGGATLVKDMYDAFDLEDIPFEVSGEGESVQLTNLTDAFVEAVENAKIRGLWTRQYAIYEGKKQVAEVLLQVDKSFKRHLTIQQIGVDHAHQRRDVGAEILRALKTACVRTSRVAHVQSTTGEEIRSLVRKAFFVPSPLASYDYTWTPPSSVNRAEDGEELRDVIQKK